MTHHPLRVGAVRQRPGHRISTSVVIAIAMAALVWSFAAAAPPRADGGAAPAPAGPRRGAAIRFADLPWSASGAAVSRRLERLGFAPLGSRTEAERHSWRGPWGDDAATCTLEWIAGPKLAAVTLRFEPATVGDALELYGRLSADLARRYGTPEVELSPTRPDARIHERRYHWLWDSEGPSSARFWSDEAGAAACVQLDGRHVVWLRWERPNYVPPAPPEFRDSEAAPRR